MTAVGFYLTKTYFRPIESLQKVNEMSGMNGMNFHSSGMILNVSEWGERQFHDVINCSILQWNCRGFSENYIRNINRWHYVYIKPSSSTQVKYLLNIIPFTSQTSMEPIELVKE